MSPFLHPLRALPAATGCAEHAGVAPPVASPTPTPLPSLVWKLLSSGRLVKISRSFLSVFPPCLPLRALHAVTGRAEPASVVPPVTSLTPSLLPSRMVWMPRCLVLPRSLLPLLVPLCTRSAAPLWALSLLHLLLLSLASLKLLVGSLSPVDVLLVDSGSGAQARDRASWLARDSAPLPNATLLPHCRVLS